MPGLPKMKKKSREWWREYRGTLAFLVCMLMFRSAWADWVSVPTGSMIPSIVEGDRVLVDKHVYGLRIPWTLVRLGDGRDPRRGEIVVFDSPVDGTSLVKRVVGLPGDTIALDDAGLVINGAHARYEPGDPARLRDLLEQTVVRRPAIFREAGVLPPHDILRMPFGSPRATFAPIVVPDGMYFMLGDNRDNSADSRYFGFVPRRNIVGHASRVAMSFDPEHHYAPRARRFFEPLDAQPPADGSQAAGASSAGTSSGLKTTSHRWPSGSSK
jgi:signal peptidase I